MRQTTHSGMTACLVLAAALVACSDDKDGSGNTSNNNNNNNNNVGSAVAIGIMTKGSVIVNGVRFDDSGADVIVDDQGGQPTSSLDDGMNVTVNGSIDDNGVDGVADSVEIENEARGPIAALLPPDAFTLLGQRVVVDGGTVYANVAGYAALTVGANVEVHGLRDVADDIRASRIEVLAGTGFVDELRGVVSALNTGAKTFSIGAMSVDYNGATLLPAGSTLANGILVEVHGDLVGGVLVATEVDVEDAEDDEFEAAEGGELHVEGFMSGFTSHPGTFFVGDQQVETTTATRLEGGVAADLANDVRVEAEGIMAGGTLKAHKIEIKDSLRIEANIEALDPVAMTLSLMGKTVGVGSETELNGLSSLSELAVGGGLRFRGFLNVSGGGLTATRIDRRSNPIDADNFILQGPVTSFDAASKSVVVLGITMVASGGGVSFRTVGEVSMTSEAFFAALTAGKLVKGRGTLAGTVLTVDELEFE
ncbi:MAG: hypothetical protein HY903_03825 [Deltaproteobacteria bacterium]|nr:hypothetical protein [Deltaproteobacteria bacterium]